MENQGLYTDFIEALPVNFEVVLQDYSEERLWFDIDTHKHWSIGTFQKLKSELPQLITFVWDGAALCFCCCVTKTTVLEYLHSQ